MELNHWPSIPAISLEGALLKRFYILAPVLAVHQPNGYYVNTFTAPAASKSAIFVLWALRCAAVLRSLHLLFPGQSYPSAIETHGSSWLQRQENSHRNKVFSIADAAKAEFRGRLKISIQILMKSNRHYATRRVSLYHMTRPSTLGYRRTPVSWRKLRGARRECFIQPLRGNRVGVVWAFAPSGEQEAQVRTGLCLDTAEIRLLLCGHLDFDSSVTAQDDAFKRSFRSSHACLLKVNYGWTPPRAVQCTSFGRRVLLFCCTQVSLAKKKMEIAETTGSNKINSYAMWSINPL